MAVSYSSYLKLDELLVVARIDILETMTPLEFLSQGEL